MYKLKAGKYYIGDPCYTLGESHHYWIDTVLRQSDYFMKPFEKKGMTAVAFGTAHGDGSYFDQNGQEYGVDSGMIGAVPFEMYKIKIPTDVQLVDFKEDFTCYKNKGVLHFGHIIIDTDTTEDWLDEDTCMYCEEPLYDCVCDEDEEQSEDFESEGE